MGTAMIETSREAFESVDVSELERRVLGVIEGSGCAGCISDEVQDMLPLLAYSSVTARFRALWTRDWWSTRGSAGLGVRVGGRG
jgi:hypothetical protein